MAPQLAAEWLEFEQKLGHRPLLGGDMENYSSGGKSLGEYCKPPLIPTEKDGLMTQDVSINDNVKARLYLPERTASSKLPVGVFGHSGAFCEGDLDTEDTLCRIIAHNYPCIVVSIDYRKAPHNKLTVAYKDFLQGFLWNGSVAIEKKCFALAARLGEHCRWVQLLEMGKGDVLKGVINCAGGTLHPDFVPDRFCGGYNAMKEMEKDFPIIDAATTRLINEFTGLYQHKDDPWVNPLLSPYLGQFPRTYLVACGVDPLRDDAILMAGELERLDVPVKIDVYDGLPHIFWMVATLPSFKRFITNLVSGIRFVLEE